MMKRYVAGLLLVGVLASPVVLSAQGPPSVSLAQRIVDSVAEHNCEVARMLADLFGVFHPKCG